jgi:hypothetical protein
MLAKYKVHKTPELTYKIELRQYKKHKPEILVKWGSESSLGEICYTYKSLDDAENAYNTVDFLSIVQNLIKDSNG